jgi:carotenoid cleavage dioxygenase
VPQRPLLGLNCALRHDFLSGESALWYAGEASLVEEPLFVARDLQAAEGDGFLLLLVNRFDERRSDLVILDAQRFDAAPLAIARLPFRLRSGLHGCWVPERELPAARAAAATRP